MTCFGQKPKNVNHFRKICFEMEPITESTPVEVGQLYPVRCAHLVLRNSPSSKPLYVPISGPEHRDPQLGFRQHHYHIDGRFTPGKDGYWDTDKDGLTNTPIPTDEDAHYLHKFVGVVVRMRKCKRLTTGLKTPARALNVGMKYKAWYDSMLGQSCKGKKCPHLGTMMTESNGALICPLHDLHACPKTEVVIPHPLDKTAIHTNL